MNWIEFLKQFGVPTTFLVVVLAFVWYVGRPVVNRLLDMIDAQLSESRAARLKDTEDFKVALERREEIAAAQTELLRKLSEQIAILPERINGQRDESRRRR